MLNNSLVYPRGASAQKMKNLQGGGKEALRPNRDGDFLGTIKKISAPFSDYRERNNHREIWKRKTLPGQKFTRTNPTYRKLEEATVVSTLISKRGALPRCEKPGWESLDHADHGRKIRIFCRTLMAKGKGIRFSASIAKGEYVG